MSPRKKADVVEPASSEPETPDRAPEVVPDVGAALYRDKSGSPRTRQMTEGQANFGAVKGLAEAAVAAAKAPPTSDKEDI